MKVLHVVIINPSTVRVELAQAFDTYKTSEELEDFIENDIVVGDIIIAACKDDCVTALSQTCIRWF